MEAGQPQQRRAELRQPGLQETAEQQLGDGKQRYLRDRIAREQIVQIPAMIAQSATGGRSGADQVQDRKQAQKSAEHAQREGDKSGTTKQWYPQIEKPALP